MWYSRSLAFLQMVEYFILGFFFFVLLILAYSLSLMLKTSSLMGSSHPVIITHTAKYENN